MNRLRYVAVGLFVTAVVGGCGDRPDIRVEHHTIESAPAALSDSGARSGPYAKTWSTTVSGPAPADSMGAPTYHLVGGHLFVVSKTAIEAYDARTGKPTWHYREPGRRIEGFTATGGVVVAEFRKDADVVEAEHMLGLDAGTGELLWENTQSWDLTYDGDRYSSPLERADAADGIVLVAADDDERLGLDARTGDEVWKLTAADEAAGRCAETPGGQDIPANAHVLPVQFRCETQDFGSGELTKLLLVVEPSSGELLWSRRIDSRSVSTEVEVRDGVTMIEPSAADSGEELPPELIGPDGTTLFGRKDGRCLGSACQLNVSGGRVLFRYAEAVGRSDTGEDTRDMLVSVDLRTGRTSRMPDPGEVFAAYTPAGGKLYSLTPAYGDPGPVIEQPLVPAGLAVLDVSDRETDFALLPYPSRAMFPSSEGADPALVAVGGGRLFTVRELGNTATNGPYRAELTAYAAEPGTGPPELGGVSPDDWPDPCRLLADLPPDDIFHYKAARPGPKLRLGDVTVGPTACTRLPVAVRVGWVAKTEKQAEQLFPDSEPSDVGADAERSFGTNTTAYRIGRTILFVDAYVDHDAIARKVIENLLREAP